MMVDIQERSADPVTMEIQAKLYPMTEDDVTKSQEALEHFRGVLEGMGVNTQYSIPVITTEEPYPPNWKRTDTRTVVKIEGYIHFDNGKTFHFGYGAALAALESGKKVARAGWNGKGQWVVLQKGYPDGVPANRNTAEAANLSEGTVIRIRPWFMLHTAQGDFATWQPSVSDCLAKDWMVVE